MSLLRHSSLTKKKRNKKSLFGKIISDFRYNNWDILIAAHL